jgi:hypothetical protein
MPFRRTEQTALGPISDDYDDDEGCGVAVPRNLASVSSFRQVCNVRVASSREGKKLLPELRMHLEYSHS